jgi:transcription elongation factor Elf1
MIFVCPHCGSKEFQLWAGVDGKHAVQCLSCGETSALDRPKLPESSAEEHARVPRSEEVTVPRKHGGSHTHH